MLTRDLGQTGDALVATVERQTWLDRLAEPLGRAIQHAYEAAGGPGRTVKNVMHGTWLGHPLHSVLTDVPIGAWTVAVALDALDVLRNRRPARYSRGADTALAVGVAGALGSALTGLTDWQHTTGGTRRLGMAHAAVNGGALLLMAGSLALRRSGARRQARLLATLGYSLTVASAYLGGHLVYRHRMGVDHSQAGQGPDEFVAVSRLDELPEGKPRRVDIGGIRVLLVRRGGKVLAINEVCSHRGGPLAEGQLEDAVIRCPWHGSRFGLEDGRVLDGPAIAPQPCYHTRIRSDGTVEVAARAGSSDT